MQAITDTDCQDMQALVDGLSGDTTCLAKYRLCEPFRYVTGSGAQLQTWVWERIPEHQWMRSAPGKGCAEASAVCGSSCPFTPGRPCCCDLSFIVNTQ